MIAGPNLRILLIGFLPGGVGVLAAGAGLTGVRLVGSDFTEACQASACLADFLGVVYFIGFFTAVALPERGP